ncbi:tRNA lysidine(34) synthetase TilS [Komagataeibacter sp. FNDCF1]|uniref:tRNA lysidine(34) synthetase TilS n=1 Tax=Komagataeibacter sp. FNDCF1 TaxID=2878681 RepID=UPI001E4F1FF2|nr:tRNA lysidine(34) synthetase TilS [Komagataeibacter sp. FNDCF1]MCE2564934.1 tRNA lysidine(34) synthetase TilS [Komagataeibacter sp. FNDCF1]
MPGQSQDLAEPLDLRHFAPIMAALGPWPGHGVPVAIAVSGGADSMALAVLARQWRRDVVGLVVDHGLRAESRREAEETVRRLSAFGMPARLLVLEGLERGPRMAERARRMRYEALFAACRDMGALDLLVAHHAGDQAETVLMRGRAASGADGLAAMAVTTPVHDVRIVRPLLSFGKPALYATVSAAGIAWVEDPSNTDLRTERARARRVLAADASLGTALQMHARHAGQGRMARDREDARWLAAHAGFHPGGWVVLPAGLAPPRVLSGLVRVVGGHDYPPARARINLLARSPEPATLAGVAIMPWRDGQWIVMREEAAMAPSITACAGAVWDRRFALRAPALPPGCEMGAAGPVASWWPTGRGRPAWPARALRTLPALWQGGRVAAVPHMGVYAQDWATDVVFMNHPPQPVLPDALFGGVQHGPSGLLS